MANIAGRSPDGRARSIVEEYPVAWAYRQARQPCLGLGYRLQGAALAQEVDMVAPMGDSEGAGFKSGEA